jgi:hypothetical protein
MNRSLVRVGRNQLSQLPCRWQAHPSAMKIDHPNAAPLSEEQLHVLQSVKQRLEAMVSSHGLTPEDVQELVRDIKTHPLISTQLMGEIREEVNRLMPGQRFTFDWD